MQLPNEVLKEVMNCGTIYKLKFWLLYWFVFYNNGDFWLLLHDGRYVRVKNMLTLFGVFSLL